MRVLGFVLLGIAILPLWSGPVGCTGAGLGEGGSAVGAVPPPNFKDPIYNGQLSGRVTFDPGFLHNWLMNRAASSKGKAVSPLQRDREFYRSLLIKIHGPKGKNQVKISEEGKFDFGTVRHGDWTLDVVGPKGVLATTRIAIEGKATVDFTVRVLGVDLADLDHDRDRHELVVEREISYRSEQMEYRRILPQVGDVQTHLPDGSLEIQDASGHVKVFRADGAIDYRYDPSNRFVDQDLEADTGMKEKKSRRPGRAARRPKDPLLAKVTGQGKVPLIVSVSLRAVGRADAEDPSLGDVAVFEVKTDANGGAPVNRVTAQVYSHEGGAPQPLTLLDDGGRGDIRQSWPGLQSSFDREKGDGIFTYAIPLDPRAYRFLGASQIVITATNERLGTSRPASRHVYLARPSGKEAAASRLPELVTQAGLVASGKAVAGGKAFCAQVSLKDRSGRLPAASIHGPGDFRRTLAPVGDGQGDGPITFRSTPMVLSSDGVYTIVLSSPDGDVYFVSSIVEGGAPVTAPEPGGE